LTEDQRAQQAQATQQAEYLRETSALPDHPVITTPAPETPTEEWLRKEKAAKEHPDPVR